MVTAGLMRIVYPCWKPSGEGESSSKDSNGRFDGLLWHKDFGNHANAHRTFVGVYDGHGGPETARYVCNNLFKNIKKFTSHSQGMSADVIMKAFMATEEEFLSLVKELWLEKPQIASVGACCLVGVICNGYLYTANAGDSRVVLGKQDNLDKTVKAIQLSSEHNASYESVREELRLKHPDDPHIVVLKQKVWRIKGLILMAYGSTLATKKLLTL
uniref:protein-serine/threonine phosphatase n=1 Tax=Chenopodium quinoa TaxID=63459 RepID=A0A803MVQ8_CHEQI